jgi:tetratricopeptide (TPR) repeat protein
MTIARTAAAVAIVLGSWSALAYDDRETLSRAKALYTEAAYDEALALLNELSRGAADEALEADQYRAFCLLALGRSDDARKVIQQIVETKPAFKPAESQVSPRLLEAFHEVRRRLLPSIVRQSYTDAKAAYDRKEFESAKTQFDSVVALLDDQDAKGAGELADLRILSKGFLDLIKTAPAPEPPAAAAPPPAAPEPQAAPAAPKIYDARDTDVAPPVAISQAAPPWHPTKQETQNYDGTLTLVIDERGDVASVAVEGSLHPAYTQLLRRAARTWKYRPALKGGQAVPYRKVVSIHLSATGAPQP